MMKVLVGALALTLGATGVSFAAKAHKDPPPIKARALAAGRVAKPFTVQVTKPADVVDVAVRVPPGASFGWHVHHSAVAAVVISGTLSLYDPDNPGCSVQRIRPGHGFVERPEHVHLARNEGRIPVRLVATYLGAPHGTSPDAPAQKPAGCTVG
jgi:quercetin dioxygenase-like cupin family protein